MICPSCKNEKWDENRCPHCGLGSLEALLAAADDAQKNGKEETAANLYEKYLSERYDPDIDRKRAICLFQAAKNRNDTSLFKMAAESLLKAVNEDWTWQKGHQSLIELFYDYDKLEALEAEYSKISAGDDSRKESSENFIKILKLTKKFKKNPPESPFLESDKPFLTSFLNDFWPLLGIAPLLFMIYKMVQAAHVQNGKNLDLSIFLVFVLGISICLLILFSMNKYRNKNKTKIREVKLDETDRP